MTTVTFPVALVEETDSGFRVDSRVYTDSGIYELELQAIFEQSWICLGHESQIASPGDYFTSLIGRHPVVITRARQDGNIGSTDAVVGR